VQPPVKYAAAPVMSPGDSDAVVAEKVAKVLPRPYGCAPSVSIARTGNLQTDMPQGKQ